MGFSLSGGPFTYNRFDDYEEVLFEKKKDQGYNDRLDDSLGEKDGKESSKEQSEKDRRDESEGEEKSKGKKKYSGNKSSAQGPRWQDSDGDGKWYEKGEDVAEDATMNSYVRALSRMGAMYDINEKSSCGSDKKKKAEYVKEDAELPTTMISGTMGAMTEPQYEDSEEEAEYTPAEYVMAYLMAEGFADNPVSAEIMASHMSDDWARSILDEAGPAHPYESKAQAKAQSEVRQGNMRKADKVKGTAKDPGNTPAAKTSGYNTTN